MHFNRSDWFTQSRLSAHISQFDLIWRVITQSVGKLQKFLDTMVEKSKFCELSTEKNPKHECIYRQRLEFKTFNKTIIPFALLGQEYRYSQRGYFPSHIQRALME